MNIIIVIEILTDSIRLTGGNHIAVLTDPNPVALAEKMRASLLAEEPSVKVFIVPAATRP